MTLKLYYDLLSPPSRTLYIFLKKCNIPFEKKLVNLGKREQLKEGYEKIHPFNKVPAIEHNGLKLIESIAILRYLCSEFKVDEHWYPTDSISRAKVDENIEWQQMNSRLHISVYFRLKFQDPLFKGKHAEPEEIAESESQMVESLNKIENIWLKDKDYLVGNKISIADIIGACDIQQPRLAGYDPRKGRPKITAWLDRVNYDLSPIYEEAHEYLEKLARRQEKAKSEP